MIFDDDDDGGGGGGGGDDDDVYIYIYTSVLLCIYMHRLLWLR